MFCSQFPCLGLKPFKNSITVLLTVSPVPLEDRFNGVGFTSVMLNSFNKALNSLDLNAGPLSLRILFGILGRKGNILYLNAFATVVAFLSLIRTICG